MKIARSDARILAHGLLADGLDVDSLTLEGRLELGRALDKVLDLCGVKGAEIVEDAEAGKFCCDLCGKPLNADWSYCPYDRRSVPWKYHLKGKG